MRARVLDCAAAITIDKVHHAPDRGTWPRRWLRGNEVQRSDAETEAVEAQQLKQESARWMRVAPQDGGRGARSVWSRWGARLRDITRFVDGSAQ